jgi:hypothetical protein
MVGTMVLGKGQSSRQALIVHEAKVVTGVVVTGVVVTGEVVTGVALREEAIWKSQMRVQDRSGIHGSCTRHNIQTG